MVATAGSTQVNANAAELVITRTLEAPPKQVWRAWTEAEGLARWWGPKGSKVRVVKLDLRPGGMFHYVLSYGAGQEIWGRFVFREVVAPERLVYVSSFSDPAGGITAAPFPQIKVWPREVLNIVTFAGQAGKTTLVLRSSPCNATAEETEAFVRMHASMRQGFGGSFEQLDKHLAGDA